MGGQAEPGTDERVIQRHEVGSSVADLRCSHGGETLFAAESAQVTSPPSISGVVVEKQLDPEPLGEHPFEIIEERSCLFVFSGPQKLCQETVAATREGVYIAGVGFEDGEGYSATAFVRDAAQFIQNAVAVPVGRQEWEGEGTEVRFDLDGRPDAGLESVPFRRLIQFHRAVYAVCIGQGEVLITQLLGAFDQPAGARGSSAEAEKRMRVEQVS